MEKINIFCFGFGQVARSFVKKIVSQNISINLTVTSREKTQKKNLDEVIYNSYQFNEDKQDKLLLKELNKSDHILISIAPVNGIDIVLKYLSKNIEENKSRWITYLSATSVYGDHNGEWVNEESQTNPTSLNGIERLSTERAWMSLASNKNLPLQIFRLSGIYSNKRNILIRLKSKEAKIIKKKINFFLEFI